MRVWMGDSPYDTALDNCCGISEVGGFRPDALEMYESAEEVPKIKDIVSRGCGIFISTLLPSQRQAYRELCKYHTLIERHGPYKNMGPDASTEGRTKGVYLCVFKFGKDK